MVKLKALYYIYKILDFIREQVGCVRQRRRVVGSLTYKRKYTHPALPNRHVDPYNLSAQVLDIMIEAVEKQECPRVAVASLALWHGAIDRCIRHETAEFGQLMNMLNEMELHLSDIRRELREQAMNRNADRTKEV